jgi:hypothetical protein
VAPVAQEPQRHAERELVGAALEVLVGQRGEVVDDEARLRNELRELRDFACDRIEELVQRARLRQLRSPWWRTTGITAGRSFTFGCRARSSPQRRTLYSRARRTIHRSAWL